MKTAMDYPWQVQLHTIEGENANHPLYSVTTSPTDSPYWLIAAPLDELTAIHIASMHNYWLSGYIKDPRSHHLREAADIVDACGAAARNGAFGDEWTSRDIRDAMESAAGIVRWMADNPGATVHDALQDEEG